MMANGTFSGGVSGGGASASTAAAAADKGSSQYRGVSWHDRSQRWEVRMVYIRDRCLYGWYMACRGHISPSE